MLTNNVMSIKVGLSSLLSRVSVLGLSRWYNLELATTFSSICYGLELAPMKSTVVQVPNKSHLALDASRYQICETRRVTELDRRATELDRRVTELDRRVTELDRHVTELDRRVTELDRRVSELDRRVTELDRCATELDHCVGKLSDRPYLRNICRRLNFQLFFSVVGSDAKRSPTAPRPIHVDAGVRLAFKTATLQRPAVQQSSHLVQPSHQL